MRAMVAKTAVVAAATGGLAASFLLPLAPHQAPAAPEEALRMPVATRETTVSVFPAPGRPDRARPPCERSQRPAAPRRRAQAPIRPVPCGPALPRRSSHAARLRRSGRRRTSASSRNSAHSAPTTAAPARSSPSSGFGTSPACEDVRVPLIRRPGPIGLALTAFEVWRRLRPSSGGRSWTRRASRRRAPLPRRSRTGAAARRAASASWSSRRALRGRSGPARAGGRSGSPRSGSRARGGPT